jgi:hypothetical protein
MIEKPIPIEQRPRDPELIPLTGTKHYLKFYPFKEAEAYIKNYESDLREFFKEKMEISEAQFQLLIRLLGELNLAIWFSNGEDMKCLPTITLNLFLEDVCIATDLINLIDEGLSDAKQIDYEEELYAVRKLRDLLDRIIIATEQDLKDSKGDKHDTPT